MSNFIVFLLVSFGSFACTYVPDHVRFAMACVNADEEKVRGLIDENRVDINAANGKAGPCLSSVAYKGSIELSEFLIDRGADINSRDQNGITPLATAVIGNHPKVVELLLKRGADPNLIIPDEHGVLGDVTALKIARARGNREIISQLERITRK